jgi:peptide/nickel transport system substrate-binding protein
MRTLFRSLAISSIVAAFTLCAGMAETRPKYGDTLRIVTSSASFLIPGSYGADDSLSRLMFDTLTASDGTGNLQPALATSWQADGENRRWQFWLRRNVIWHDGAPLAAVEVAQSIAAANTTWHVRPVGDSIVIETDTASPGLAAEVGMLRNAVMRRGADGTLIGTGPYKILSNANGRTVLQVNQDDWRGRAFLDSIEITSGRLLRDQGLDLELGRADLAQASVEDLRRAASGRVRLSASRPVEMMALVFSSKHATAQDDRLRDAIAQALDRTAIQTVFLQRQGEANAALLPNWMTGYAFAFPAAQDLARARQLRAQAGAQTPLAVGYTTADALARTIAERVVLNARDAGFVAQLATDMANADVVVERIELRSGEPFAAMSQVASEYGLPLELKGASWQDLFNAERDLLSRRVIVPIVHVPRVYAAGPRVRNFRVATDGTIDVPQLWVATPVERQAAIPGAR